MIDQSKTYRTKCGCEVRIYAVDGMAAYPIHGAMKLPDGWNSTSWAADGQHCGLRAGSLDLVEADPHGILPRHRELLASVYEERGCTGTARTIRDGTELGALQYDAQAALIALARLDGEKGE